MFRRPLPSTNLGFLSTVMWDGRETVSGQAIRANIRHPGRRCDDRACARCAAGGRSDSNRSSDFELSLFTAQTHEPRGRQPDRTPGALAGRRFLSRQPFCIGINDPLNILPVMPGACQRSSGGLNPTVFTLFAELAGRPRRRRVNRSCAAKRSSITSTFVIDNVAGLNREPRRSGPGPIQAATCTICHDTPNAGDHSDRDALEHRRGGCRAPDAGHAALHAAEQRHGGRRADHRSRPGHGDWPVERRREVQRTGFASASRHEGRTFTTDRRRRSRRPSTSTTSASTSVCPHKTRRILWRS